LLAIAASSSQQFVDTDTPLETLGSTGESPQGLHVTTHLRDRGPLAGLRQAEELAERLVDPVEQRLLLCECLAGLATPMLVHETLRSRDSFGLLFMPLALLLASQFVQVAGDHVVSEFECGETIFQAGELGSEPGRLVARRERFPVRRSLVPP
jgi:hypothetical protein